MSLWAEAMVKSHPGKVARHLRYYDALRREQLLAALAAAARCAECGKKLSDPTSVERGIGPDCWSKREHAALFEL